MSGDRVEVLGCGIDRVTLDDALARCAGALTEGTYLQQFSVNAAKVVAMRNDPKLTALSEHADLVTADGSSIVLASRLFGDPLPERVTGIDLMHGLLELAEREGHGVYILGAAPEILNRAVARLRELHPRLRLAGYRDGYFDPGEDAAVRAAVRDSGADILFVAMGSPRSEHWLADHGPELGVRVAMGVGGSIDVLAGKVRRAPPALQRLHLEWLYRLAQEPRRLIRRNLASVTFWRLALRERLRRA